MTDTPTSGSLTVFDHVRRGDTAPDWVRAGIERAWTLPTGRVTVNLIAVSENVTFKVVVDGGARFVVRLGRPGYAESTAHVESELLWVEAIRSSSTITTPAPCRGRDEELVQFLVDDLGGTWTAVAFDFIDGVMLEDQQDFVGHFVEIGTLTAQLHAQSRSWRRPQEFKRFEWGLDDMTGPSARWGDWRADSLTPAERTLLEDADAAARTALSALDRSSDNWGLIHSDLRPSNIMSTGGGLAVIDFDDCGDGYYLYDFGAALTFYEHREEALAMSAGWLDGYRAFLPLSKDDLTAAVALSMMRRLTMLGWATTHRADALPDDLWQENRPGTLAVAELYLRNPLWLVD